MADKLFQKVDCFISDLGKKIHNLDSDTLKIYLTNSTIESSSTVYTDDLATGGGYTAGGQDISGVWTETDGTGTLTGSDYTWEATEDGFGPFRYVVLYNATTAAKNLIGFWDYGRSITLDELETFEVAFGVSILTISFSEE